MTVLPRCMLYLAASSAQRGGCPAVRVYWCAAPPCDTACTAASTTKSGGLQFGKPCPRFTPFVLAARAPNSLQTVGPDRPASLRAMMLCPSGCASWGEGWGASSCTRSFSSIIMAPSLRSRRSTSPRSLSSASSMSSPWLCEGSMAMHPPSKQTSPLPSDGAGCPAAASSDSTCFFSTLSPLAVMLSPTSPLPVPRRIPAGLAMRAREGEGAVKASATIGSVDTAMAAVAAHCAADGMS
mmetsp:Transcript_22694/g.56803  ORF Transcript_22694/g.56803 Transcript_22694/m.56803 type:complete len:239 (-) Transcript_22694:143-859(-)